MNSTIPTRSRAEKSKCPQCNRVIRRFGTRGKPFKYCSVDCDKEATAARLTAARGQERRKCDALSWAKDDKDYVRCDETKIEKVTLKGQMLSVTAHLCWAHQVYISKRPKEWINVDILNAKGQSISRYPNK